jgi:hypothetical protein
MIAVNDDQVLTFDEWCRINNFSRATGQRLRRNGQGPHFIQLSEARIGVTVGENRRWQKSRLIESTAA